MRMGGVAAVVFLLCAFAPGRAAAASTPEFDVTPVRTTLNRVVETYLDFMFPVTAPAPAKIAVSIPAGYTIQGDVTGSRIAYAEATVQTGGRALDVEGSVTVEDPSKFTGNTCAPGAHAAVWTLSLPVSLQVYAIPLFVDGSTEQGYTIQACLQSPDVPPAAGGAPGGARITYLGLDFEETFRNPANAAFNRWSALVTPFAGGTATADPAAVYELRAMVALPEQLTLSTSFDKKTKSFLLSGSLTALGRPEAGIRVHIWGSDSPYSRFKELAVAKTDSHGRYSLRKRFPTSMWLTPFVNVYIGECDRQVVSPAPSGCLLQSWSPVFGNVTHATLPKGVKPPAKAAPAKKTRR